MSSPLLSHLCMLGSYNRLANERLYEACSGLSDEERTKDRGAFFGSIHGTLSHILVGDRIWMTRFEGGEAPRPRTSTRSSTRTSMRCARPASPRTRGSRRTQHR